jgi:superfamily II DNA or RNA helicase
MATGMKKYRRTVQRAGRGMRPKNGTNKVYIFDFWDENHLFLKRQSEYRLWTYREEEFDISESLNETANGMGIPIEIRRHNFGGK